VSGTSVRTALLVAVLLASTVAELQTASVPSDAARLRTPAARGALFDVLAERLEEVYWDPSLVDWAAWRAAHRSSVVDAEGRGAFDAAMRRAVEAWGDGHSRWVGVDPGPRAATPFWLPLPEGARIVRGTVPRAPVPQEALGGPVRAEVDLGAEVVPLEGQGLLVVRVHPGGAADAALVRRSDLIVAVNGEALRGPGLRWEMLDRIAAALRSGHAELRLERPGVGAMTVALAPRAVPEGAREAPRMDVDPGLGVARLEIPGFRSGDAARVHALVAEAQVAGARLLVVDVRGNRGGAVTELGLILATFLGDGAPLEAWTAVEPAWRMQLERAASGGIQVELVSLASAFADPVFARGALLAATQWTGPVAVLIDGRTASAGEALAALLRSERDAIVVGEATEGNVEAVRRLPLPGGNAAWVAVAELRLPHGVSFDPVEPDVAASLSFEELARGYDAPLAIATQRALGLPFAPFRWFAHPLTTP